MTSSVSGQDEPNPALIGYPSGQDKDIIDQASSVKMAGYWSSSLFAFLGTETK